MSKLDICTSRWPQHQKMVNGGGGCEMLVLGRQGVTGSDLYR